MKNTSDVSCWPRRVSFAPPPGGHCSQAAAVERSKTAVAVKTAVALRSKTAVAVQIGT